MPFLCWYLLFLTHIMLFPFSYFVYAYAISYQSTCDWLQGMLFKPLELFALNGVLGAGYLSSAPRVSTVQLYCSESTTPCHYVYCGTNDVVDSYVSNRPLDWYVPVSRSSVACFQNSCFLAAGWDRNMDIVRPGIIRPPVRRISPFIRGPDCLPLIIISIWRLLFRNKKDKVVSYRSDSTFDLPNDNGIAFRTTEMRRHSGCDFYQMCTNHFFYISCSWDSEQTCSDARIPRAGW